MLSSTKTHRELTALREEVGKKYPRRSLWKSNSTGRIYRITGCTLEADTYRPRVQFVASGSAGPSFNLLIPDFQEEFEYYTESLGSNVIPD